MAWTGKPRPGDPRHRPSLDRREVAAAMNWSQLQRPILFVPRVSLQRWVLTALALTAAVGATTFTSLAADHRSGVVLVLVIALALASVVNPDTHVATGTVVLVLWQWFVTTDD